MGIRQKKRCDPAEDVAGSHLCYEVFWGKDLEVDAYGYVVVDGLGFITTILHIGREVGLEGVANIELVDVDTHTEVETKLEYLGITLLLFQVVGFHLASAVGHIFFHTHEVELEVRTEEGDDVDGGAGETEFIGCVDGDAYVHEGEFVFTITNILTCVVPSKIGTKVEEEGNATGDVDAFHETEGCTVGFYAIIFIGLGLLEGLCVERELEACPSLSVFGQPSKGIDGDESHEGNRQKLNCFHFLV